MSLLLAFLATAALQGAQDPDPRWLPFLGCWEAETAEADAAPGGTICIRPAPEGVSVATLSQGAVAAERLLRIGSGAVAEGGCRGTERTQWSQDGRRLLIRSDLECTGGLRRSSAGVLALVSPAALVDIQAVSVAGDDALRVLRYRAVEPGTEPEGYAPDPAQSLALETARMHAALPLDMEAVLETHRTLNAAVLEGLLAARRAGYALDAATLLRLADAGLPPSTLDLLIALSYPEHFEVREERAAAERIAVDDQFGRDPWDPRWGTGWSRYGCYGYSPYYYSPYGCDPYGWNRGGGGWIYVVPSGGGTSEPEKDSGTAVKGRGYRQGESATKGTARPRLAPEDRAGSGRGSLIPSGRSSGDRATPSGSSGGSSGSGRKAKPRDG